MAVTIGLEILHRILQLLKSSILRSFLLFLEGREVWISIKDNCQLIYFDEFTAHKYTK
jgi:hypothetical protein